MAMGSMDGSGMGTGGSGMGTGGSGIGMGGSGMGTDGSTMMMMNVSGNSSNPFPCGIPPFFPPFLNIPEVINYIQACIALLFGVIGFTLNLFILLMIAKYKSLHQRLMYLALHIVSIDLLYTTTIPLVIFTSGISGRFLFGEVMCNILGMIHDFCAISRYLLTLILTLDRFISVFRPFFYRRNALKIMLTLLPIMYTVFILRGVLPLPGIFSCYLYVPTQKTCTAFTGCSVECFWLVIVGSIVILVFGIVIPFCLYIVLFCKVRAVKKQSKSVIGSVVATSMVATSIAVKSTKFASADRPTNNGKSSCALNPNFPGLERVNLEVPSETGLEKTDVHSSTDSNVVENGFKMMLTDALTPPQLSPDSNQSPQKELTEEEDTVKSDSRTASKPVQSEDETEIELLDYPSGNQNGLGPSKLEGREISDRVRPSEISTGHHPHRTTSDISEPESATGRKSCVHTSVTTPPSPKARDSTEVKFSSSNVRASITIFILLMSVVGCTAPAWVLYLTQFLYLELDRNLFILNMMIGRTFFYLLPIIDAVAIMRHQEFRVAIRHFFCRYLKRKLHMLS